MKVLESPPRPRAKTSVPGSSHPRHAGMEPAPRVPLWKRGLDLLCIGLALPVLLPVFVGIACWIKLVSRGPVFFRQNRVGFRCLPFACFKFRSMKHRAETDGHQQHLRDLIRSDRPMVKMDSAGDARIIPGGRLLRATGMDELPQLINVALGDMSLVGPRPCTQYEFDSYLPWHKERFNTLPGLTGYWQVNGKNKTTFTEMINMDIFYARHKSLWLDLRIMSQTFSVLAAQTREMQAQSTCNPPAGAETTLTPAVSRSSR